MKGILGIALVAVAMSLPAATSAAPLQSSRTILKVSSAVSVKTKYFSVPSKWKIHWSFKCSQTISNGVFEIAMFTSPHKFFGFGIVVASVVKSGAGGSGTRKEHGAGRLYLAVATTCPFHLQVTS